MRARALIIALTLVLLFDRPANTSDRESSPGRPVVLIIVDALRFDHLQTYGYSRDTSPNILRWSKGATVFDHAYPAGEWTRPSILSLMTGRYSSELTVNPGGAAPLAEAQETLAKVFRRNGYRTVGIYNTGQLAPEASGLQLGFDSYTDYGTPTELRTGSAKGGVDAAILALKNADKPIFLMLHILDPHAPYEPQANRYGKAPVHKYHDVFAWESRHPVEEFLKNPEPRSCGFPRDKSVIPDFVDLYDSEIHEMDSEVNRLLAFLDATPRYHDALVILTADHGEEFGEHGGIYHGSAMTEENLRVPLIVRDPLNHYSRGRRFSQIVSLIDLAPTILDAAGISYEQSNYSGRSLKEFFWRRGDEVKRDTAITERISCGQPRTAIRIGDWKLVVYLNYDRLELYNLREDPTESTSLAGSNRKDAREALVRLGTRLKDWQAYVGRPLATRDGKGNPELPPELQKQLEALGYLQ